MGRSGGDIRHVAADAAAVVLICRKCSRKLDGGFGRKGDERLAKVLARALRDAGQGKTRPRRARCPVIEVECLDVCPKGAVVALRGDRPGDWLMVPRGMPVSAVGAALGVLPPERAGGGPHVVPVPPVRP